MSFQNLLPNLPAILFLFSLISLSPSYSQTYTATKVADLPPSTRDPILSYAQGEDSIYIFSEAIVSGQYSPFIHRFNIFDSSLETITDSPTIPFQPAYAYGATINSSSYLLGIGPDKSSVLKLDHPYNISYLSNFSVHNNNYGAGAYKDEIIIVGSELYKYNPRSGSVDFLRLVPPPYKKSQPSVIVIEDNAYVFGRPSDAEFLDRQTYYVIDLVNFEFFPGPEDLNFLNYYGKSSATYDGKYIYVFPNHPNSTTARVNGIYVIDPKTSTHEFIPVQNYPPQDSLYFIDAPQSVYVEELNGIFLVGGTVVTEEESFKNLQSIWFVDLNLMNPTTSPPTTTLNPDLFSCSNRTDGKKCIYETIRSTM